MHAARLSAHPAPARQRRHVAGRRRASSAGADGRYTIDFDAFERAITPRTRMFLLCNPHNPVGRVFTRDELLADGGDLPPSRPHHLRRRGPRRPRSTAATSHVPIASLDPEIEARTITLMAPSKTFNLAGLKSSLAVIPNQALREKFMAARAGHGPDGEHPGLHGHARGVPRRAAVARRAPALPREQPRLPREVRPGQFPGDRDGRARGHLPRLARLPARRGIPSNDPFTFFLEIGPGRLQRRGDVRARRARASCGSTSAARAPCSCRGSSAWRHALGACRGRA